MSNKTILKSLTSRFLQQGISLWKKQDEIIYCVENMNTDLSISETLINAWDEITDYYHYKQWHIFRLNEIAVVFQGSNPIDENEVFQFLGDYNDWFQVLVELETYKKREQSFHLLIDVAHTVVSSMQTESDRILDIIIELAVQTFPAADTGFLLLYDEKIKKLLVKSAVGFREESYRFTRLSPNEGISGKVFYTGEPVIINGEEKISEAMKNMTKDNMKHYIGSTVYSEYPVSVISVPLIFKGKKIGVVTIDNYTHNSYFTNEDLLILSSLADHVAVAIVQAELFKKEKEQRKELLLMHGALRKEHERLQKTTDLHNNLMNIAAQGKGISSILDALYRAIKVPLAIYDNLLTLKFESKEATNKHLPKNFFQQPTVKHILRNRKWQSIHLDNGEVLMIFPIFGAERLLGFLFAWIDQEHVDESHSILLEYGGTVIALEWTKLEAVRETRERLKGEILGELLSGEINEQLVQQAEHLGLKQQNYFAVVLCRENQRKKQRDKSSLFSHREREQWLHKLDEYFFRKKVKGIPIQYSNYVLLILSFDNKVDKHVTKEELKTISKDIQSLIKTAQISIGRIYKGLNHVNKSYDDAQKCFEVMNKYSMHKNMLNFSEIGVYRFFLQHHHQELESFLYDILGPLIRYVEQKNKNLLTTLLAYVQYDRDLSTLTSVLKIHYNTLYYRVNRIQEILEVSFDEPEDWFNIQLACQVYHFLNTTNDEEDF